MVVSLDARGAVLDGTGTGRHSHNLAAALARVATDHTIKLIMPRQDTSHAFAFGERFQAHTPGASRHTTPHWEQLELPVELQQMAADVHVSPMRVLPAVRVCPYVMVVYDLAFERMPESFDPKLLEFLLSWIRPSILRADAIIAVSEYTRTELMALYGIPAERITVIPCGVERRFRPAGSAHLASTRERLGLPERFVLVLSSSEQNKNVPLAVRAFAGARTRGLSDYTLVLAGRPGLAADSVRRAVAEAGIEPHVRDLGFVADEELPALYTAAELLLFPSLYEGFGLPPLEAMACGTPVVCSDATSLPEVVGEAGVLLDPRNEQDWTQAILDLCFDESARSALSRRGIARAEGFSWEETARRTLAVLEEVADQ